MAKDGAKKIVILKTGSTFAGTKKKLGDFDDWIMAYAGLPPDRVSVFDITKKDPIPNFSKIDGVIITGSHTMVTDRCDWIDHISQWVAGLVHQQIPVLGICFGHQLLAQTMGGKVDYHPGGREIGTVDISLTPGGTRDNLMGYLAPDFPAHTTHAQTVVKLPEGASLLAFNGFEPHHAFRIGRCAWGVQFHPEFSEAAMRSYIANQAADLKEKGYDIQAIESGVTKTAAANALIERFISLFC